MNEKHFISSARGLVASPMTRRRFLSIVGVGSAGVGGLAVLSACGGGSKQASPATNSSSASAPAVTVAAPKVVAPSPSAPAAAVTAPNVVAPTPRGAGASSGAGQTVTMYIFRGEEGVKGPDGKGHDAVVPSSMVVVAGQPVTVHVINSDEGKHTITSKELNLDQEIAAGNQLANGDVGPVTTTFTLTAPKAGVFRWDCELVCDGGGGNWAMTPGFDGPAQPGFMAGSIVAIPAAAAGSAAAQGEDSVNMYIFRGEEGIKGPDGKGHDAVVPSSMVVKAGRPITVNVFNSDEGKHTITSKELNLDREIAAGKQLANGEIGPVTTTFTFTAPKQGVFRWDCEVDCDAGGDHWAMTAGFDGPSQPGFMAGSIVAI